MKLPIDAVAGQGDTIMALNAAGVTMARIGGYVGRSETGVGRWLRKRGLLRARRMTPETRAEIERLYYEGLSIERIAGAVGRSHGGVRYYLQKRDLWRPERTRVTPKMATKIRQWYDRGVPIAVIGDRLGITEGAIYNHVRASRRGSDVYGR